MSDEVAIDGKPPTSFWIIGGVALIWNLLGLMIYYMSVTATPEHLASYYSEEELEFMLTIPKWATAANATAVTFGVIGCVLLLLRKAWAIPAFVVSLVGLVVQDIYGFVIADTLAVWGAGSLILPAIVLIIAIGLIVYSRNATTKGWIA